MIRRTTSSFSSFLAPLTLLLALGLVWGGCSSDSAELRPTGPSLDKKGPPAPPETFLVLDDGGGVVKSMVLDEGATITHDLAGIEVLIIEGEADLPQRLAARSNGGIVIETPIRTGLSRDIELIMSFYESFDGLKDYGAVRDLGLLELPTIHTGGVGAGVQIAQLDTRVDFSHPHLAGHLVSTRVSGLEAPEIDIVFGPHRPDAYGHGTHVAGLIVSVAPGARIWPMVALDDDGVGNSGMLAIALNAVVEMKTHGIADFEIVNMSLALESYSQIIQEAVIALQAADIYMLAGAGNTGFDTAEVVYPAAYAEVIAIGATDGDGIAPFSARDDGLSGGPGIELGAPGLKLLSSYPDGEMHIASGTSMACGVASGSLAILLGPVQTNADISNPTQRLYGTADDIVPADALMYGRVSLLRSLQMLPIAFK